MASTPSRKTSRVMRRTMIALMGSAAAISFAAVAAIGYTLDPERARPAVDKVLALIGTGERNAPIVVGTGSPLLGPVARADDNLVLFAPGNGTPELDVMAESRSLQNTTVQAFGMELLENQVVNVFRAGGNGQGFGGPGEFQSFSQGTQTTWRTASFSGPAGGFSSFGGGGGGGGGQGAPATFASEVSGDWLLFAVNHRALGIDPQLLAQNIFNSIAGLGANGGNGSFFGPGGVNGGPLGGGFGNGGIALNQNPGVVPIPAALPLFGTALAALAAFGWRNRRRAAKTAGAEPA